jgi:hypothetical protein
VSAFLADFAYALRLAKDTGQWEGDYNYEPRVFWSPDPDLFRFSYGFVWKQDNNGTTFIISPQPLKWLEDDEFKNLKRGPFHF